MTLLLGPPSSGKTTLLLALAGKLDPALKVKIIPFRLRSFLNCQFLALFKLFNLIPNLKTETFPSAFREGDL
jgi:ABC-type multidrug transport system ATPase subunit